MTILILQDIIVIIIEYKESYQDNYNAGELLSDWNFTTIT